jgi:ABC-type glycerol-3-phosphate transport system permease component
MVNYVRLMPREFYDAMVVAGTGQSSIFRRLVVPMTPPVLAVVTIYSGLGAGDNFLLVLYIVLRHQFVKGIGAFALR